MAPPKVSARLHAKIVAGFCCVVIGIGVVLTLTGTLSVRELATRSLLVGVFGAALSWSYAWILRVAKRSRAERMPLIHAATGSFGLLGYYGAGTIMLQGLALGNALNGMWWMVPFSFGTGLAVAGLKRRAGDSLHCPKCEYEFKFDVAADAPARCPECGTPWLGMLKKGRRVRSGRLIAVGAAVTIGAFLLLNPVFYIGSLAPHLPTSLLYASLYTSPRSVYTAWDELATRPLDAGSIEMMARRVIRFRAREQYDSAPSGWFEKMVAARKIPAGLLERYYAEAFVADLSVPRRVRAGQEFEVSLRVSHVANGWGDKIGLMFGGYRVGDETAAGREDATLWEYQLRPGVFEGRKDVAVRKVKAEKAGEVRVKATWWIVVEPSFREELKWTDAGEPRTPASALWFRRFDAEKVVRVE